MGASVWRAPLQLASFLSAFNAGYAKTSKNNLMGLEWTYKPIENYLENCVELET